MCECVKAGLRFVALWRRKLCNYNIRSFGLFGFVRFGKKRPVYSHQASRPFQSIKKKNQSCSFFAFLWKVKKDSDAVFSTSTCITVTATGRRGQSILGSNFELLKPMYIQFITRQGSITHKIESQSCEYVIDSQKV